VDGAALPSPDGRYLALVVDGELARLEVASGRLETFEELAALGEFAGRLAPCDWTPDGSSVLVAFAREESLEFEGLGVYTWDSGEFTVLDREAFESLEAFVVQGCGAFEPGVAAVVYSMIAIGDGRSSGLYRAPIDGGPAAILTTRFTPAGAADVSADGTLFAFEITTNEPPGTNGATNWDIAVLDGLATGGEAEKNLTRRAEYDFAPSISPDGTEIAFVSNRGGRLALWVIPVAGGRPRKIANLPGQTAEFHRGVTAWSPEGRRVAVSLSLKDGPASDFFIVNVAQGRVTPIGQRAGFLVVPRWLPDGSGIVF
jgi:Tol biopolymer transport system component